MRSPTARRWLLVFAAAATGAALATCSKEPAPTMPDVDAGVPVPPERCVVPLDRYLSPDRGAAHARRVESPGDLVGGPRARGKFGDYLLANEKLRVVLQAADRHIGPNPYGATILDADLVHDGPGRDQLGELGLLYNFGRTVDPTVFEILADGGDGGPAIVAMSGHDTSNDYLRLRNQFRAELGRVPIADPDVAVPMRITNYFVLNPGEPRVRFVTAFCNDGPDEVLLAAGDLADPGQALDLFNGLSCTGGFGSGGTCGGVDSMSWYGYQGAGVAYGYAPWREGDPTVPETSSVTLTVSGVTGSLLGAPGMDGLLAWFNPRLRSRGGELRVPAAEARAIARDFVVGKDLGEVAGLIEGWRGASLGDVAGTITSGGAPLAGARVAFESDTALAAVFVTQADGSFSGRLAQGLYAISAWAPGRAPTAARTLTLSGAATARGDFDLPTPRTLHVSARDAAGAALPAKVTASCDAACPAPSAALVRFFDAGADPLPSNVQLVGFVPPSGEADFALPAGRYHVLVSRGPEYSVFPNAFPSTSGEPVDLTAGDGAVSAVLVRVLDTTGFVSADLHVHAVASPDSAVDNLARVLTFAGEGVDVLVATDHDVVTDFAPFVQEAGAEAFVKAIAGEEVSPMDYGHYNLFPLTPDPTDLLTGGALDWAGGRGPTLTVGEIFAEGRRFGATTVAFNHPRMGGLGGFSALRVDTDTLATHALPEDYAMAPQPGATAADTRLVSADFNTFEVVNGASGGADIARLRPLFNDWFTLLSRGLKIAGTAVSDTHGKVATTGGYGRTLVETGEDDPRSLDPAAFSASLNALKAVATNAPFVRVEARRVDAGGNPTSGPAGMGEVLAASADAVRVTLDVQVPEYLDVTLVELYVHRPEDDAACPVDPSSPEALTTRVACDGAANDNWPDAGIAATQAVTLEAADLVVVAQADGQTYRRWQKEVALTLPAPATDNWIVALVYGSKSLFPLVSATRRSGGQSAVTPFAFTNPIFVDADGNGYDRPPFRGGIKRPGSRPAPSARPAQAAVELTRARFLEGWKRIRDHGHP